MDKSLITLKSIEKYSNDKIKITADIKNIGDNIWEANQYTFRSHFITYNESYIRDVGCLQASITEIVNPEETVEKTIYVIKPRTMSIPEFWHPENLVILDTIKVGAYWMRCEVQFKIKEIEEGVKEKEYTSVEIASGETAEIELDVNSCDLINLKHLRIEPVGDFNPCYGDDFQNLDNWQQLNGEYAIENDSAKLVTSSSWVNLINNDLGNVTNSTVEVFGKLLSGSLGGYFGILFGYQDASNYWRVSVRCNNGNYLCIYHYVNGVNISADYYYVGYTITPNRFTSLKLDIVNNTVKVYIDNGLMFEYTHNQIIPGKVGLTAYKLGAQQVWLDDFQVGQGVYNSYLYNRFIESPLISKINKSTSVDMISNKVIRLSDKKIRIKILNAGASNTFKIKLVYKLIKSLRK